MGVIIRGDIGIPRSELDAVKLFRLQRALTRQPTGWADNVPDPVCCLTVDDNYAWIPRYFDAGVWNRIEDWQWTDGEPQSFEVKIALDPERGQPDAVSGMVDYLQQHNSGILIMPTGCGKTLSALAIGAAFGRKIGVLVYAGHMIDNWTEHAELVFGLVKDDVGIFKEGRCDVGKPVTLISVQTLLSRGLPPALREQIGFVIADEIQRHAARRWREALALFPTRYRLGITAKPSRKDGLEDIIFWSMGQVGHRAERIRSKKAKAPDCAMIYWRESYSFGKYCRWKKQAGQWKQGDPDPMKYDKVLAADDARTSAIADEIYRALCVGRQILVLTRLTDHRDQLMSAVRARPGTYTCAALVAGQKDKARKAVIDADAIFATYSMARDALNVPKLDTLFFATPPGDPLQPIGRLREKVEGIERRPLLIVDCYEKVPYSERRMRKRTGEYSKLGISTSRVVRSP